MVFKALFASVLVTLLLFACDEKKNKELQNHALLNKLEVKKTLKLQPKKLKNCFPKLNNYTKFYEKFDIFKAPKSCTIAEKTQEFSQHSLEILKNNSSFSDKSYNPPFVVKLLSKKDL